MSALALAVETQQCPFNFRFERTTDYHLIRRVIANPSLYRRISEDGSPSAGSYLPPTHDSIWWLSVFDDLEFLGIFAFFPETSACWSIHVCLLPHAAWFRGRPLAAMLAVFEWIWDNSQCHRIIGKVPSFNTLALRLARKASMIEFGRNRMSFPKNGKLYDQVLFGIMRPGVE